jgi:exo-beta-1,3-glucanase (GH17 family)
MKWYLAWLLAGLLLLPSACVSAASPDTRNPFFTYLTGQPSPTMICYTPSELDPRSEVSQRLLKTSSIRKDLEVLRDSFDGLVLYGYHEANTPRILAVAKTLKYRAVLLGVWDIKSATELDGVAALATQYQHDFALGVLVGNEGLTFGRYEEEDLAIAEARLRPRLPKSVPIATSEPLVGYGRDVVVKFGDFLAPNIHPVFDRKDLAPAEAAAWAREQATAIAKKAKKPVLLKETGFPHAGDAKYTRETQAAFWEAYLKPDVVGGDEKAWTFHGVGFEAFDLPWKAAESKLEIEKSWGLVSPKREPYPALKAWQKLRDKDR